MSTLAQKDGGATARVGSPRTQMVSKEALPTDGLSLRINHRKDGAILGGLLKFYDYQAASDLVGPANIKQRMGGTHE
jgi:hypothetical protein